MHRIRQGGCRGCSEWVGWRRVWAKSIRQDPRVWARIYENRHTQLGRVGEVVCAACPARRVCGVGAVRVRGARAAGERASADKM